MRILFTLTLILSYTFCFSQSPLKTPEEFLGYDLGDRFTRHHRVVEYFQHVADVIPNVSFHTYGETYEHRPLTYAIVTSPENFNNLENIRINNLRRAGAAEGPASGNKVGIVWLSYNVHGNEANSMEASMRTLYELADKNNTRTQEWLKNTVVILDPCINPDGRDRYANFYNQYGNHPPNADGDAKEHHEPWPGGRANHYLFDLNRDWAWETQTESESRIRIYNQWLPHVHVDFHEQGHNNPYYFAPAAEPYHEVITPWQREFQTMIGKNNAKYFDEQGWLYFTKEIFDLYYPSYGDTYPTYSGAIGMTYEQAGGGYAGLTITTETGDPLTLKERLTHHHTAGLSTIEITSKNADRVVDEFEKYFRENNNSPASPYKTYVIKSDNNRDKISRITRWLKSHDIRFGHPGSGKTTKGFDYQTHATTTVSVSANDIIIPVHQPKSRFITTIFEPESRLPDSLTYDITAWNLMYAYDLKAYALPERIAIGKPFDPKPAPEVTSENVYAYIFRYESLDDVTLLSTLLRKGIKVRSASKSFTIGQQVFAPGSLIVTRRNNEGVENFDGVIRSIAKDLDRMVFTSSTGFVEKGKDFGSSELSFLKAPVVGCLFGEQTSSLSAGEIWHFFEQQIRYPITQLGTDYFARVDIEKFDVLIIPEGNYRLFEEPVLERISQWVSSGGRLILVGSALNSFADRKGFGLKKFATEEERAEAERREKELKEKEGMVRYEDAERKQLSEIISGAIYNVQLDHSHPLGFGLDASYFTLKTNELRFAFLEYGWNVGILKGNVKPVQGFAGYKSNRSLTNSLVFGVEEKGRGKVIYMVDNPLFRCFWENGKMLFANAVFIVGQ